MPWTSETLSYSYDAANNLLTANITDGTNAYNYTLTYDKQNRTATAAEPFGVSLTLGYDPVGNRTSVSDSFGGAETSVYNGDNQLTSRSFSQGGTYLLHAELAYFTDGSLEEIRNYGAGSPAPEVAKSDYTYYNDGRLDTLVEKDSAGGSTPTTTVNSFSYAYDSADRLTSKTENSTTTTYGYDNTNQITGINGSTVYGYDGTGGRTGTGVNVTTGNELQTDGTYNYTYDHEGNESTKTTIATGDYWTYGYDNKNEMTSAVEKTSGGTIELSATYRYDALGDRVEADVTPYSGGVAGTTAVTRFALDLWKNSNGHLIGNENADVWADLTGTSSLATRYLRGDVVDQVFARMVNTSLTSTPALTPYWYLTDNLGSVRNVVDNSGNLVDTVAYGVYGNVLSGETNATYRGRYGWTGREMDVETGLQYNRARYYDAGTGRWLGQDPLGFDAGDSNLYRYVNNQPTEATDPSGFITIFFHGYNQGSSGSGSGSSGSSGSSSAGSSAGGSSGSSGSKIGGSSESSNSSSTGNEQNNAGRYPQFRQAGENHFEYHQVASAVELVKKVVGSPENQKEPIVLIGHSWGGAAAIEAAKQLAAAGYKVDLLATIDPVTRGGFLGLDALLGNCQDLQRPNNVKTLWNWYQDSNWPVGDSIPKADKNIKNLTDKNGVIFGHRDIDTAPSIVDAILKKAKDIHDNFKPNKK